MSALRVNGFPPRIRPVDLVATSCPCCRDRVRGLTSATPPIPFDGAHGDDFEAYLFINSCIFEEETEDDFPETDPDFDSPPAETYLGRACPHCDDSILLEQVLDRALITFTGAAIFHLECGVRLVAGSVGHQRGLCICNGGTEGDPPNATRREAAQAAFQLHQSLRN